jgi:EAL domain-containing protein (putative c-di-GMP-specific phosphodiesterase class I)/GAF domain-containing protein
MPCPDAEESAYGAAADALLRRFAPALATACRQLVSSLHPFLEGSGATAAILSYVPSHERPALHERLLRYLVSIFEPGLRKQMHAERAHAVGRLHMLIGVQETWLIKLYSAFQDHVHTQLLNRDGASPRILQLMRILDRRLLLDLESQVGGIKAVEAETLAVFTAIFDKAQKAASLHDLYNGVIAELAKIDGMLAVFVARLDEGGWFEIEDSVGPRAEAYLTAMNTGVTPRIHITPGDPSPGPAARAWLSGKLHTVGAYHLDPSLAPWQHCGMQLGFCSCAFMPLVNEDGETFALVSLYSGWAGFFQPSVRQLLFGQIQQALSAAVLRHRQHQIIPVRTKLHYLGKLAAGQVAVEYQPILNLKSGFAAKFEALARLRDDDGTLIAPGQFLGALGNNELLRLFTLVLGTACADLQGEMFGGQVYAEPPPVVSVNLPPQGLSDLRYTETLFTQLQAANIPGQRIELELLESSDVAQSASQLHVLAALRRAGIALIQDDLGSGHSSLLRMGSLRFEGVKIEQGLVRGATLRNPWHVLEFIYHLTNLAHSLGVPVTVEGLENRGLIEAAAILGVDYGQGYAIARPMPAGQIASWRERFVWTLDRARPETELGLLSAYLLWDMRLKAFPKGEPPGREFLDQTCPLQTYLTRQPRYKARRGALFDAVRAHHQAAVRDIGSNAYKASQAEIIALLSEEWRAHAA